MPWDPFKRPREHELARYRNAWSELQRRPGISPATGAPVAPKLSTTDKALLYGAEGLGFVGRVLSTTEGAGAAMTGFTRPEELPKLPGEHLRRYRTYGINEFPLASMPPRAAGGILAGIGNAFGVQEEAGQVAGALGAAGRALDKAGDYSLSSFLGKGISKLPVPGASIAGKATSTMLGVVDPTKQIPERFAAPLLQAEEGYKTARDYYQWQAEEGDATKTGQQIAAGILLDPVNWGTVGGKAILDTGVTLGAKALGKAASKELAQQAAETGAKELAQQAAEAGAKELTADIAEQAGRRPNRLLRTGRAVAVGLGTGLGPKYTVPAAIGAGVGGGLAQYLGEQYGPDHPIVTSLGILAASVIGAGAGAGTTNILSPSRVYQRGLKMQIADQAGKPQVMGQDVEFRTVDQVDAFLDAHRSHYTPYEEPARADFDVRRRFEPEFNLTPEQKALKRNPDLGKALEEKGVDGVYGDLMQERLNQLADAIDKAFDGDVPADRRWVVEELRKAAASRNPIDQLLALLFTKDLFIDAGFAYITKDVVVAFEEAFSPAFYWNHSRLEDAVDAFRVLSAKRSDLKAADPEISKQLAELEKELIQWGTFLAEARKHLRIPDEWETLDDWTKMHPKRILEAHGAGYDEEMPRPDIPEKAYDMEKPEYVAARVSSITEAPPEAEAVGASVKLKAGQVDLFLHERLPSEVERADVAFLNPNLTTYWADKGVREGVVDLSGNQVDRIRTDRLFYAYDGKEFKDEGLGIASHEVKLGEKNKGDVETFDILNQLRQQIELEYAEQASKAPVVIVYDRRTAGFTKADDLALLYMRFTDADGNQRVFGLVVPKRPSSATRIFRRMPSSAKRPTGPTTLPDEVEAVESGWISSFEAKEILRAAVELNRQLSNGVGTWGPNGKKRIIVDAMGEGSMRTGAISSLYDRPTKDLSTTAMGYALRVQSAFGPAELHMGGRRFLTEPRKELQTRDIQDLPVRRAAVESAQQASREATMGGWANERVDSLEQKAYKAGQEDEQTLEQPDVVEQMGSEADIEAKISEGLNLDRIPEGMITLQQQGVAPNTVRTIEDISAVLRERDAEPSSLTTTRSVSPKLRDTPIATKEHDIFGRPVYPPDGGTIRIDDPKSIRDLKQRLETVPQEPLAEQLKRIEASLTPEEQQAALDRMFAQLDVTTARKLKERFAAEEANGNALTWAQKMHAGLFIIADRLGFDPRLPFDTPANRDALNARLREAAARSANDPEIKTIQNQLAKLQKRSARREFREILGTILYEDDKAGYFDAVIRVQDEKGYLSAFGVIINDNGEIQVTRIPNDHNVLRLPSERVKPQKAEAQQPEGAEPEVAPKAEEEPPPDEIEFPKWAISQARQLATQRGGADPNMPTRFPPPYGTQPLTAYATGRSDAPTVGRILEGPPQPGIYHIEGTKPLRLDPESGRWVPDGDEAVEVFATSRKVGDPAGDKHMIAVVYRTDPVMVSGQKGIWETRPAYVVTPTGTYYVSDAAAARTFAQALSDLYAVVFTAAELASGGPSARSITAVFSRGKDSSGKPKMGIGERNRWVFQRAVRKEPGLQENPIIGSRARSELSRTDVESSTSVMPTRGWISVTVAQDNPLALSPEYAIAASIRGPNEQTALEIAEREWRHIVDALMSDDPTMAKKAADMLYATSYRAALRFLRSPEVTPKASAKLAQQFEEGRITDAMRRLDEMRKALGRPLITDKPEPKPEVPAQAAQQPEAAAQQPEVQAPEAQTAAPPQQAPEQAAPPPQPAAPPEPARQVQPGAELAKQPEAAQQPAAASKVLSDGWTQTLEPPGSVEIPEGKFTNSVRVQKDQAVVMWDGQDRRTELSIYRLKQQQRNITIIRPDGSVERLSPPQPTGTIADAVNAGADAVDDALGGLPPAPDPVQQPPRTPRIKPKGGKARAKRVGALPVDDTVEPPQPLTGSAARLAQAVEGEQLFDQETVNQLANNAAVLQQANPPAPAKTQAQPPATAAAQPAQAAQPQAQPQPQAQAQPQPQPQPQPQAQAQPQAQPQPQAQAQPQAQPQAQAATAAPPAPPPQAPGPSAPVKSPPAPPAPPKQQKQPIQGVPGRTPNLLIRESAATWLDNITGRGRIKRMVERAKLPVKELFRSQLGAKVPLRGVRGDAAEALITITLNGESIIRYQVARQEGMLEPLYDQAMEWMGQFEKANTAGTGSMWVTKGDPNNPWQITFNAALEQQNAAEAIELFEALRNHIDDWRHTIQTHAPNKDMGEAFRDILERNRIPALGRRADGAIIHVPLDNLMGGAPPPDVQLLTLDETIRYLLNEAAAQANFARIEALGKELHARYGSILGPMGKVNIRGNVIEMPRELQTVAARSLQPARIQQAISQSPLMVMDQAATVMSYSSDIGSVLQQAGLITLLHPGIAIKMVAAAILDLATDGNRLRRLSDEVAQRVAEELKARGIEQDPRAFLTSLNLAYSAVGDLAPLTGSRIDPTRLPGIGTVVQRSGDAFSVYLNTARMIAALDLMNNLSNVKDPALWEKQLKDGLSAITDLTGASGTRATALEFALHAAPSLARSQILTPISAFKGGKAGAVARRRLAMQLVIIGAITYAANELRGEETNLFNPTKPRWMTIRNVYGYDINLLAWTSFFNAVMRSLREGSTDPLWQWESAKMRPLARAAVFAMRGSDMYGNKYPQPTTLRGAVEFGGRIGYSYVPLLAQQATEDMPVERSLQEQLAGRAVSTAAGFFGARANPVTVPDEINRQRNRLAQERYGKPYEELTGMQKSRINETPEIRNLLRRRDELLTKKADSLTSAAAEARLEYARRMEAINRYYITGRGPDGRPYTAKDAREAIEEAEQLLIRQKSKDPLLAAYWGLSDAARMGDGRINYQLLESLRQEFVAMYPEVKKKLEETVGQYDLRVNRDFRRAREQADRYYSIPPYKNMSLEDGLIAQRALSMVSSYQRNGGPSKVGDALQDLVRAGIISEDEAGKALAALKNGRNPERKAFVAKNPEFAAWYLNMTPEVQQLASGATPRLRRPPAQRQTSTRSVAMERPSLSILYPSRAYSRSR